MIDVLQYQFVTPYTVATGFCGDLSPAFEWMINGKLGENPIVTPGNTLRVVSPSARNRYLQSVTVQAKVPVTYSTRIAINATTSFGVNGATTVISETPATATATVANNVVTVTGVAAGTTTVRAYDSANNLVGLIVVTVA